jgi:hypothetical protein
VATCNSRSDGRRRFYELAVADPAPIASEALERIAGLYTIEGEIRGRTADERRAVRQEKSRPMIDELEPWLRAKLALISQKTKLAEAIRYALSRWIEIDSNVVERAIRPVCLIARTPCSPVRTAAANTGLSSPP